MLEDNKTMLVAEINTLIELCDIIVTEADICKEKIQSLLESLKTAKEEGKDLDTIGGEYKRLSSRLILLNDDKTQLFFMLMGYYKAMKLLGIEDKLSERDSERLQFLIDNNQTNFIVESSEVKPREQATYDSIMERMGQAEGFGEALLSQISEQK